MNMEGCPSLVVKKGSFRLGRSAAMAEAAVETAHSSRHALSREMPRRLLLVLVAARRRNDSSRSWE
jgi:hypothetical protein